MLNLTNAALNRLNRTLLVATGVFLSPHRYREYKTFDFIRNFCHT